MTDFPVDSDFADGVDKPPGKLRDLINATRERILTLTGVYTGKANRLVKVRAAADGIDVIDGTEPIAGVDAPFEGLKLRDGFLEIRALSVGTAGLAGKVVDTTLGTEGWVVTRGVAALLTLGGNLNANGLTMTGMRTAGLSLYYLRIAQDGTGGRQINSGTSVGALFPTATHEFPLAVVLPTAASAWVDLQGKRVNSGKIRWTEIDRS